MRLSSRLFVVAAGVSSLVLGVGCGRPTRYEEVNATLSQFMTKSKGKEALTSGDKVVIVPLHSNACDRGAQMPQIPVPNGKGGGLGSFGGGGGGLFGFNPAKYNTLVERIISTTLVSTNAAQVVELSSHNYANGLVKPVPGGAATVVDVLQNINWPMEGGKIVNTLAGPDMCLLTTAKERNATKVFGFEILELGGRRAKIHYRISDVATGVVKAEGTYLSNEGTTYDSNFVEMPDQNK